MPDAVFGRPAIAGERVVFGSRDGTLRGLSFDGKEIFRLEMGGPVMAPPLRTALSSMPYPFRGA